MPQVAQSKESAENLSFTNEGSNGSSTNAGKLSGNGGPTGKYRIQARAANWNGGSASFQNIGGTVFATFFRGNDGHADVALPSGTYLFTFTDGTIPPQGVQAHVIAI